MNERVNQGESRVNEIVPIDSTVSLVMQDKARVICFLSVVVSSMRTIA